MVTNVTSLTGNGLRDWLIQRVTAIILGVYFIYMLVFFLTHSGISYQDWKMLHQCNVFRIVSVLTVIAMVKHAWIGLWTVTTDYIKCAMLRVSVQMLILFSLLALLVWFLMILWG